MKINISLKNKILIIIICLGVANSCFAHDIIFCGERIPVENGFVSSALMNVIRKQIPNVNMPLLRKRAEQYFPFLDEYLNASGLPQDLKYLAIVESGFQNQTSAVGARGIWQLMAPTAKDFGLTVSEIADDRDNFYKSTKAACNVLTSYYQQIHNRYKVSSWVLTAAAYNTGIGNLLKVMSKQGNDYFSMNLNPETAVYVYKIIAVKELFEFPELYMKDFGFNVFSVAQKPAILNNLQNFTIDSSSFKSMTVNVDTADGIHPDSVTSAIQVNNNNNTEVETTKYIAGNLTGKYKKFSDGQVISIVLQDDLNINGIFNRKGVPIKGVGWFIDNRILVDLGYENHAVTLISGGKKGIDVKQFKNNQPIILKVITRQE